MGQANAHEPYDIFIIGGGINGCGIARDAAGRGYSVALAEMNDLASGTSSGSTKLIHGGLRYLEHFQFRLVREALKEREILWANAPHIIWPLRFILPHHKGLRPSWFLRLGLFIYDHIGGRKKLPATRVITAPDDPVAKPLKQRFTKAFEYSDCWVNDARLVVLNARDAANNGARIMTRTKVTAAKQAGDHWNIEFETSDHEKESVTARSIVNAAGPWVDQVLKDAAGQNNPQNVRLVQGSHIIVKQLFDHGKCYIFQTADGRIIFAIPYEEDFTLIGTTDRDFEGDPSDISITQEEITYLLEAANEYFQEEIRAEDVIWSFSAVRPLYDDGASKAQEATRDYVLKLVGKDGTPPLINIFGGKITTYRKLSESVLEKLESVLGKKQAAWTRNAPLPGGDFKETAFHEELAALGQHYPFLEPAHARHLLRLYGTDARAILNSAKTYDDLGEHFGGVLWQAEVDYLVRMEWAITADDILWRRTKQGLALNPQQVDNLSQYLQTTKTSAIRQSA